MPKLLLNLVGFLTYHGRTVASVAIRLIVVLLCWRGGPWVALLAALLLFSESAAAFVLGKPASQSDLSPRPDEEGRPLDRD